jgi:hypothetical protein
MTQEQPKKQQRWLGKLLNRIKPITQWFDKKIRSDKQVVEDYLEQADRNLILFAQEFVKLYNTRWLTIDAMFKNQRLIANKAEFTDIIQLLCLKSYCVSKEENGVLKFRITLSKQDKIKALTTILIKIELERDRIIKQIEALKKTP